MQKKNAHPWRVFADSCAAALAELAGMAEQEDRGQHTSQQLDERYKMEGHILSAIYGYS